MDNLFRGQGIEITLNSPENFLKVKETLTRIGVPSSKDGTLYQSCHILHKRDRALQDVSRYAILHFKELFVLDGRSSTITNEDLARRNTVVDLLQQWGLLTATTAIEPSQLLPLSKLKIISHKDKAAWKLESKYTVGAKKGK
jgi:hypothetical protein